MHMSVIERIDHVFAAYDDPEPVLEFFWTTLGLPVAWPYYDYGQFASGGVIVGSANLEILRGSPGGFPAMATSNPARLSGLAFEPTGIDDAWLAELDARRISHTPTMTQKGDGQFGTGDLWVNVGLGGLVDTDLRTMTFTCRYLVKETLSPAERLGALNAADGGALGVVETDEIVLGTTDIDTSTRRWQRLLDPITPIDSSWKLGVGPRLSLIPADSDAIDHLTLAVRDVATAQRVLDDADVSVLNGLDLRLV